MSLTLGMDTGGTYTDGVIIDRSQNNAIVCKAKSPTTRENLVIGIRNFLWLITLRMILRPISAPLVAVE